MKKASEEIHSLNDYYKLYGNDIITNFIFDELLKLATSEDAINWYIQDCHTPIERSTKLERIKTNIIYNYLESRIGDITKDLLNTYKVTLADDFDEQELQSAVLSIYDQSLAKEISEYCKKYAADKIEAKDEEFYHLDIDPFNIKIVKDSVGDINQLTSRIDYNNRTAAFVDIDGQILISNNNETHAQLINKYLSKNEGGRLDDDWYRPDVEEVSELTGASKIAFGHICQCDVWVIEEIACTNISVDEVVSDIKKSGNEYSKIYSYCDDEITRLAKLAK